MVVSTRPSNCALNVGISSKTTWTEALWAMIYASAFSGTSTDTRLEASIIALLRKGVAGLTVLTVSVTHASVDALSAAPMVRVAHQVVRTAALVATWQVRAGGTVCTWATAVQALIDISALRVYTHISCATVMIFSAFREWNQAAAFLSISSVARQAFTRGFMIESSALGVDATNSSKATWVLAVSVDAGLVERAVVMVTAAINTPVGCTDFSIAAFLVPSA